MANALETRLEITAIVGGSYAKTIKRTQKDAKQLGAAYAKTTRQTSRGAQTAGREVGRLARESREAARTAERHGRASAQAGRALREYGREAKQATGQVGRLAAAQERRKAAQGKLLGAVGGVVAVGAGIGGLLKSSISFEESMANVGKVTGLEGAQLKALGKDAMQLSRVLPIAAQGLADIMAAGGEAGVAIDASGKVSRQALLGFTKDAAKLGVAIDVPAAQAGEALAGLRAGMGLNQAQAMDAVGAYNHLSNNMAARAKDILDITARVGASAANIGISPQDLGALGAVLLAKQSTSETAATGLRTVFLTLSDIEGQSEKALTALDALGLSVGDIAAGMKENPMDTLFTVLERAKATGDEMIWLQRLFGEEPADQLAKLTPDAVKKAMGLANSEAAKAVSIEKEYAVRANTTANKLQLLSNRANALAITIGDTLLPALNRVIEPLGGLADKVGALAERFPSATAAIVGATGALVVGRLAFYGWRWMAAAATETAIGFGRRVAWMRRQVGLTTVALAMQGRMLAGLPVAGSVAAGGIGKVTRGFRLLRLAIIGTGIGAAILLIGGAVAGLVANWGAVSAFFGGFVEGAAGLGAALLNLGDVILNVLGPVGDTIRLVGKLIGWLWDSGKWLWNKGKALVGDTLGDGGERQAGANIGQAVTDWLWRLGGKEPPERPTVGATQAGAGDAGAGDAGAVGATQAGAGDAGAGDAGAVGATQAGAGDAGAGDAGAVGATQAGAGDAGAGDAAILFDGNAALAAAPVNQPVTINRTMQIEVNVQVHGQTPTTADSLSREIERILTERLRARETQRWLSEDDG